MTYLNIISTLLLIVLIGISFQMVSCIDLMRDLLRQIKPSDEVILDVDAKWGSITLADTLLRKIRDLERQQFTLDVISEKLEELNDFNQLSPEQKERIFELKNLSEMLKTAKPSK
jgi:hypothetical protein